MNDLPAWHWRNHFDLVSCPRDDGGRLHDRGEITDIPGDPDSRRHYYSCSVCGKFWPVMCLRRKDGGAKVTL